MAPALELMILGDVHVELDALQHIIASAQASGTRYDGLLCTGDFGGYAIRPTRENTDAQTQLYALGVRAVQASLEVLGAPVLFVPGNHDTPEVSGVAGCRSIDRLGGHPEVQIRGWRFVGVGGSPKTDAQFPYEWDDRGVAGELRSRELTGGNAVWLLHTPPFGGQCDIGGPHQEHLGSRTLRTLVELRQPPLVVCGHIHEATGCEGWGETLILNAGAIKDVRVLETEGQMVSAIVYSYYSVTINRAREMAVTNHLCVADEPNTVVDAAMWCWRRQRLTRVRPPNRVIRRARR